MASSTKNDKDDQLLLSGLDGLFPKEYTEPQKSITQSLSESLNNNNSSKKGSPAGSIGNEEISQMIQSKNALKKLEDLKSSSAGGERVGSFVQSQQRGRSSSADRTRKDQKQHTHSPQSKLQQKSQSPRIDTRNHSINTLDVDMPVKKSKKQLKREMKKVAEQQAEKSNDTKMASGTANQKKTGKESKGSGSQAQ